MVILGAIWSLLVILAHVMLYLGAGVAIIYLMSDHVDEDLVIPGKPHATVIQRVAMVAFWPVLMTICFIEWLRDGWNDARRRDP